MAELSKIFGKGIESFEILNERLALPRCLAITKPDLKHVERLIRRTPPEQRVRVAGRLDMIRHSDRMFALVLETGHTIQGTTSEEITTADLAGLFGREVMVSGRAVFRPSGSVQRIDADRVEPARGDTSIWSRPPVPTFGPIDRSTLHKPQRPGYGLDALIGFWQDDDESDEEVVAAIEEIS